MGKLSTYYAAADLTFIGGSFLPFGEQNLIEVCTISIPIPIGSHVFNFTQVTADAVEAGAAPCRYWTPRSLQKITRAIRRSAARDNVPGRCVDNTLLPGEKGVHLHHRQPYNTSLNSELSSFLR